MKITVLIPTILTAILSLIWMIYFYRFLSDKTTIFLYFFVVLFVTLGVFTFTFSLHTTWDLRGRQHWPDVTGVITSSTCELSTIREHTGHADVNRGYQRHSRYTPRIKYRYAVHATEYFGTGITFVTNELTSKDEADSVLRSYPVGKSVPVYYSPHNPAISVLEKKTSHFTSILLVAGLLFLSIGLCVSWGLTVFAYNGGKKLTVDQVFTIPSEMRPLIDRSLVKIEQVVESHPKVKSGLIKVISTAQTIAGKVFSRKRFVNKKNGK